MTDYTDALSHARDVVKVAARCQNPDCKRCPDFDAALDAYGELRESYGRLMAAMEAPFTTQFRSEFVTKLEVRLAAAIHAVQQHPMSEHGWINALPDGAVARCGGPHLCSICATERCRVCGCIGSACFTAGSTGAHRHENPQPSEHTPGEIEQWLLERGVPGGPSFYTVKEQALLAFAREQDAKIAALTQERDRIWEAYRSNTAERDALARDLAQMREALEGMLATYEPCGKYHPEQSESDCYLDRRAVAITGARAALAGPPGQNDLQAKP